VKNRKLEIGTSGSVRGGDGNILTYSAARERSLPAFTIKGPRAYIVCRYELLPEVSLPLVSGRVQPMARGYPMATKQAYLKGKEKGED
jgi:hypothetical protein